MEEKASYFLGTKSTERLKHCYISLIQTRKNGSLYTSHCSEEFNQKPKERQLPGLQSPGRKAADEDPEKSSTSRESIDKMGNNARRRQTGGTQAEGIKRTLITLM